MREGSLTRSEVFLLGSCAALLLSAAVLPFRAVPSVYGYPLTEDGYYALTVARFVAQGHGYTIDGLHATGGVQPLWVLLLSLPFTLAAANREILVRLALAVEFACYAAAALLTSMLAARVSRGSARPLRAAVCTAVLYLAAGSLWEDHFNGLETGLTLALYGAVVLAATAADWRCWTHVLAIGVASGVLILARVDTVFFVALLVPLLVRPDEAGGRSRWIAAAVLVPCVAAILASPWFLYNRLTFGHVVPSGAIAQAADRFSKGRVFVSGLILAARLVPLSFDVLWPSRYAQVATAALATLVLVALVRVPWRRRALAAASEPAGRVASLFLANSIILALWYGITSRAWWMYPRYSAPAVLVTLPVAGTLLAQLRGRRAAVADAMLLALSLSGVAIVRYAPATAAVRERPHVLLVDAVRRAVPADQQVGALQSGTLGYFRDNVVNLDGKVNEGALAAQGHLLKYCDEHGIRWLADWPFLLERDVFHGPAPSDWRLVLHDRLPGCDPCNWVVFRKSD